MMIPEIVVKKAIRKDELDSVFAIRKTVFVGEQNCPPELEWEYEEDSVHFLALYKGQPAGAARWRQTDKGYKLERFAVLKEFRGKGVGRELVRTVLSDLPPQATYIYLHAQVQAVGLYLTMGFKQLGEQFEEAGIQHYKMVFHPESPL